MKVYLISIGTLLLKLLFKVSSIDYIKEKVVKYKKDVKILIIVYYYIINSTLYVLSEFDLKIKNYYSLKYKTF